MPVNPTLNQPKLPQIVTKLPGPKAKEIVERDRKVVSPSYTREYPLVASSGRGAVVEDVDGNTFLDFAAGIAVVATGHCHPDVVTAIQKQAARLIHMSCTDFYYEGMVELGGEARRHRAWPGEKESFLRELGNRSRRSRP